MDDPSPSDDSARPCRLWPSDLYDNDDGGGEQTQARYWPKLPSDKLALISVAYSQINTGFTILQAYLVVVIRDILLLLSKFEI